ncbi:hypothetical protein D9758_011056 [Tetrapyrgos nigripes]|uniref:Tyrosinase copper-binding domain-containing protein n=1 Tax=Tetrapyrgos nigripes TaxID=182062 RepID=A0A8H5CT78_9AGAR|nr:hypothetical protein D9758_011056 [Tetrapyrgos nigripes]
MTASGTFLNGTHSIYDDFSLTHDMLEDFAHENAYFLPWHRYFTYLFDLALREKCGYRGSFPYWDWTKGSYMHDLLNQIFPLMPSPLADASDITSSPVFDPDSSSGLGTNGDCTDTDCNVHDGAFSDVALAYPISHRLRRNITLTDPKDGENLVEKLTPHHISDIMVNTTGDFFKFQYRFSKAHNNLHFIVKGDMNSECPTEYPIEACELTSFASNDPLFWLHHGQIDRLWSKWQSQHPDNFYAFKGYPLHTQHINNPLYNPDASVSQVLVFDRLSAPVVVEQVFNHTAPPFCYTYID